MLLDLKDVEKELKISKFTIYRMIRAGKFPAPKKLGRRSVWRRDEVTDFINSLTV